MTQPTKAALEEAKRVVSKLEHGIDEHRSWLREIGAPIIATALTAAEERGRKAGEERIQKLRDRLELLSAQSEWIVPEEPRLRNWKDVATRLIGEANLALAEDDALAAKEKEV